MLRAQYELDDTREGEIICNRRIMKDPTSQDPESEGLISGPREGLIRDEHSAANRNIGKVTWKLPAWVNFSYSVMNPHAPRPQHRRPNPFGPHKNNDLTESPTAEQSPQLTFSPEHQSPQLLQEETSNAVKVTPDGHAWNMSTTTKVLTIPVINKIDLDPPQIARPVVRHAPPAPWDDQGNLDLPYDNPFYSRAIDNVLWLPRNPLGVLDLDDTVDLKVSITVEAPAGRLGSWLGIGESSSPEELVPSGDSEPVKAPLSPRIPFEQLPDVDGTEDIDLPLVIAKRVQAKEGDVEKTLRPRKSSAFIRKASGDSNTNGLPMSVRQRRASTLGRPAQATYRSFSGSTGRTRPRSGSMMTTLQVPVAGDRARSSEALSRPDVHAQAEFVVANTSASRISLAPQRSRTQNVSAAQAIYHEVMEEERQALADRLEEETAQANQSRNTTSWLLSWMFRRTN